MPSISTSDNKLFSVIIELSGLTEFLGGIPLDYFYKEVKKRGIYSWDISIKKALQRLEKKGEIIVIDFHIKQRVFEVSQ